MKNQDIDGSDPVCPMCESRRATPFWGYDSLCPECLGVFKGRMVGGVSEWDVFEAGDGDLSIRPIEWRPE
ncbi:MAG: hypothetical protein ACXABY_13970 [Candidatus Thorarchaeota archaeon]